MKLLIRLSGALLLANIYTTCVKLSMGFHLVFQNKQTCRWKYAIYYILYLCVNVFHIFSICDFFRLLHAKHSILSEWNENKYCKFTQYRAHTHQCTGDCNCCAYVCVCVCVRGDGLAYLWWSCGCGQLSIMRLPHSRITGSYFGLACSSPS